MHRRGLTVLELMVLVLVVGAASGWLLMQFVRSREAARWAQCHYYLKQIGLAMLNYQSTWGTYPMGYVSATSAGGTELGSGWAWGATTLPYTEQAAPYNAINFWTAVVGPEACTVRRTVLRSYLCPTEGRSEPADFHVPKPIPGLPSDLGPSSYVACAGTSIDPTTGASDGGFGRNISWKVADFTDGLSQTLMVGERTRAISDSTWTGVVPEGLVPGVQHCTDPSWPVRSCGPAWGMVLGVTDLPAGSLYPTVTPSSPRAHQWAFGSLHGGGANFAIMDGSVRFIRDTIDPKVFRASATRASLDSDINDSGNAY